MADWNLAYNQRMASSAYAKAPQTGINPASASNVRSAASNAVSNVRNAMPSPPNADASSAGSLSRAVTYVLLVLAVLAIIGIIVAIAVMSTRAYDKKKNKNADDDGFREHFLDGVNHGDIRHPKNAWYHQYLRRFYSKGSAVSPSDMMFNPSVNDIACVALQENVRSAVNCESAMIDTVTVRDRSPSLVSSAQCSSLALAKEPLDPRDAELRILSGIYTFRKSCVPLRYSGLSSEGNRTLRLKLPKDARSTLVFMLSRPIFLITNTSFLYAVKPVKDGETFSVLDSHKDGDDPVFDLERVTDERIWKSGPQTKALNALYSNTADGMMLATLFYLNYEHPIRYGLADVEFQDTKTVTLVIRVTKSRLGSGTWFNNGRSGIRVSRSSSGDDRHTVTARVNGSSSSLTINPDGYVVVVCTTDMMLLCYMSRHTCKLKRAKLSQAFSLDSDDRGSFESEARSADVSPPAVCWPNTLFGVPNLYDVYSKLVAFA